MKTAAVSAGHSRFRAAKRVLLFWCLWIGLGALAGSLTMLIDPSGRALGMDAMLPFFQVLPFSEVLFQDFVFSGIALLLVNGVTNLIAAWMLITGRRWGVALGGIFGVTLMLWICIQFVIFPPNVMSTLYFFFGLAQACTGWAAWVFERQERFFFDPTKYAYIGSNPRELVVYFSRMGYTRKVAYETADRLGAVICELHTPEKTTGTAGFWWCGRFGMRRLPMPIEPLETDPAAYDRVTLCTPIWVFSLCAPMRQFCMIYAGRLKRVDYVLVHHMRRRFLRVANEMDALLRIRHNRLHTLCCRLGRIHPCDRRQNEKGAEPTCPTKS